MLTKILLIVGTIVMTLVIAGAQKYLSTRRPWPLGAIVPMATVVIMGAIFYIKNISPSTKAIVPCVILIALELFVWIDGRRQHKQNELRKMKARDI